MTFGYAEGHPERCATGSQPVAERHLTTAFPFVLIDNLWINSLPSNVGIRLMPSTNRVKVGILGATGYSGIEAVRLLAGHPFVELSVLTSEHYAGREVADVYRHLAGIDLPPLEELRADLIKGRAEVVFSCLPGKSRHRDDRRAGAERRQGDRFLGRFPPQGRGNLSLGVRRRSSRARASQAVGVWAQRVQSACAARGQAGRESRMLSDRRAARRCSRSSSAI